MIGAAEVNLQKSPLVLIVEDAEDALQLRMDLFIDAGCVAIGARSSDEAMRELLGSPKFDIVITDINLDANSEDKSGLALAKYLRESKVDIPIAGYSGHFKEGTLDNSDLAVFDKWYERGSLTARGIRQSVEECKRLAIRHRDARKEKTSEHLVLLRDRYSVSPIDVETLRRLRLGCGGAADVEETLHQAGYNLRIVKAGSREAVVDPFIVWVRKTDECVEVEVYGHPSLYAFGHDEDNAIASLIELMQLFFEQCNDGSGHPLEGGAKEIGDFLAHVLDVDEE